MSEPDRKSFIWVTQTQITIMKTIKFLALTAAALGFAISASCCSKSSAAPSAPAPSYVAPSK